MGAICEISLQLRRTGRFATGSVFDWLVTPFDGLLAILQDDGARLGRGVWASHDGAGAACLHYNVLYWHEFPRRPDGKVLFTARGIRDCRDKMQHKMQALIRLCAEQAKAGGRILFVRLGAATDAPSDRFANGTAFTSAELNLLVATLERRFPSLFFSVLFVEVEGSLRADLAEPLDPRVTPVLLPCAVANPPPSHLITQASDSHWDALLGQLPLRAPPVGGVLGDTRRY